MQKASTVAEESVSEEEFLQNVRQVAQAYGWDTWHVRRSKGSDPGFPDLFMLRNSQAMAWELKSMKGKVTPAQQKCLDAMRKAYIKTAVFRPSDWPTIHKLLK